MTRPHAYTRAILAYSRLTLRWSPRQKTNKNICIRFRLVAHHSKLCVRCLWVGSLHRLKALRTSVATNFTEFSPSKCQAFRTDESVDVGSIDDGGFFVGWVKEGEFLHYTVDVLEDGKIRHIIRFCQSSTTHSGRVLTPHPESLERTDWEYYLPDQLVLIGYVCKANKFSAAR